MNHCHPEPLDSARDKLRRGEYASVARSLANTRFADIQYVERTTSTNADAADVLGDQRFAGRTVVAEHQTLGVGRKGRVWLARPNTSLLFTTILPESIPAARLWTVPFWAALALQDALREEGVLASVLWPNDLLLGVRKVSGILCVSRVSGERAWVGVGIGINVHRHHGAERGIEPPPAFCDDVARVTRPALLRAVLARFDALLPMLDDPQRVAAEWQTRAQLPKRYRILKDGNALPFDATAIALADGGGLIVERDGARETISLGDARALR
jgi:BirA family biotin operon repressor/biotin-[acetyl-CoA-carboxylase] ligase